jgi:hypothetical protein
MEVEIAWWPAKANGGHQEVDCQSVMHFPGINHRGRPPDSTPTAAVNVAASTAPVIRIRAPLANSTSIAPTPIDADDGGGAGSATTTAGTKLTCCSAALSVRLARNARRHCNSCEREMPWRRAVAETCRAACKLSRTIVTAQVGWIAHERRRDFARFEGSLVTASMIFQPCFLAVEKKERMIAKSIAPSNDRKPPEIFWRSFIMRPSRSA